MCHKKVIPPDSSLPGSTPIFLPVCWTSLDDPQAPQPQHVQNDTSPPFLLCPLFWVMSQAKLEISKSSSPELFL